jgi:hypothetical protein
MIKTIIMVNMIIIGGSIIGGICIGLSISNKIAFSITTNIDTSLTIGKPKK